jgi:hypothetical protein
MKARILPFFGLARTLIRVKDRTGVYKLPDGNMVPNFTTAGRRRAMQTSAAPAPAPGVQPVLFAAIPEAVRIPMAAPAAAPVQSFAPAPHPPLPPKDQPSAVKSIFSDGWNKICALRPKLPSLRLRAPALFRSRSRALDARPRAQTELALEKVTVIRNDLSEADLVVVAVERKPEEPQSIPASGIAAGQNPWTRVTARWIKLGGAGAAPEPARPALEFQP